jgi:hypothetical protein
MLFVFLVWVETQKGWKRCASSPLQVGWLFSFLALIPLRFLLIRLTALTPPDGFQRILGIPFHEVDNDPLVYFRACDRFSTITARKTHLRLDPGFRKDHWR